MTLILQGMRRSGTTIVYDALDQDPSLSLWYEPLAAAKKPAIGGGSGAREVDLFSGLREARDTFVASRGLEDPDVLNHGAPRDAALEFTREFPEVVESYLLYLMDRPGPVAAKFTRLYAKVKAVHQLFPNAAYVQLVRDPRSIVASYLFGKNRRNEKNASPLDVFFGRQTDRSAWSSYPISELVRKEYAGEDLPEPTDLERLLLIWRFTFEKAWADARECFGDRAIIVRHEDFCEDPGHELERIYHLTNRVVPDAVTAWASAHVRLPGAIHAEGDPRWGDAFDCMRVRPALELAGYADKACGSSPSIV